MLSQRTVQAIRLALAVLSTKGWLLFVIGFGKQAHMYSHTSRDYVSTSVAAPLWGFMMHALAVKTVLFLHILTCNNNIRQIIYSSLMFLHTVYLLSAGMALFLILILYSVSSDFERWELVLMTTGCVISVFFYWISMVMWPLTLIRKQKYSGYQELLDSSAP